MRFDLYVATIRLEALLHGIGELSMDLFPGAADRVSTSRVAVRFGASGLGGNLKNTEDFVSMGTHETTFACVCFDDAVHNTHQSRITGLLDILGNAVMILDSRDERSKIGGEPCSEVQAFIA